MQTIGYTALALVAFTANSILCCTALLPAAESGEKPHAGQWLGLSRTTSEG